MFVGGIGSHLKVSQVDQSVCLGNELNNLSAIKRFFQIIAPYYKPCIIVSLFGCVMNYCNLAKCVTIYELYSLSNDMNETCLSCIEQNQIVLIVCQIPKIVQTAFV